jgi:L-alanine-DL-glutamate epimerase-like enolase superfamily enzyme
LTTKPLRVDANEGWTSAASAREILAWLSRQGVELAEQPLPASDSDGARALYADSPLPLVADESALGAHALAGLAGAFHGVNVKLAKCGGLTRALDMVAAARALGLRVMLGCMIESSLGIAAALQLAPLADWIDLDGNLLLARDPFAGLGLDGSVWRMPQGVGLGVEPRLD